jgi:ankyrin repeat protein
MHLLAYRGHTHLLRLIYQQYCANRTLADSHSRNPLVLAVRAGHVDAIDYLVNLDLDMDIKDEKGLSLVHYAASSGSLQMLNAVLEYRPTSTPCNSEWSPLHWACRAGNPAVFERLVQEGFHHQSVILSHPEGNWSPVSVATFHGNGKMLQQLTAFSASLLGDVLDEVQVAGRHGGWWCNGCFHVSKTALNNQT